MSLLIQKRDAMVSAMGESFGGTGTKWSSPTGGLYVWVTFPEHVSAVDLQPIAFEAGIGFNSGRAFAPNDNGDHCARLCFGYESVDKNREGIELLAEVIDRDGYRVVFIDTLGRIRVPERGRDSCQEDSDAIALWAGAGAASLVLMVLALGLRRRSRS